MELGANVFRRTYSRDVRGPGSSHGQYEALLRVGHRRLNYVFLSSYFIKDLNVKNISKR